MSTLRLTAAQATVRWLAAQQVEVDGAEVPYFAGVWAIFGHGNVAGLGEALHAARDVLPTYRAHNEQGMAHAAIAYAKQLRRRRAMVCTTSIGPGATNLVTAAALAHVNRLPVLLLPGDVYANRRPDPVLQQVEDFHDATISANDCLRPVSRFFDRIVRADQIIDSLPRALATMLDPAACGPATLAFCQDVQAEAFDYPEGFFARRVWRRPRLQADAGDLDALADALRHARRPLLIAGGGVHYSGATDALASFASATGLSVAQTQAGLGALPWDHRGSLGAIGVTGTSAANAAASTADVVLAIGTRLQDFTTGSRTLFAQARLFQANVQAFDARKHGAHAVVGDALHTIEALSARLAGWKVPAAVVEADRRAKHEWLAASDAAMSGAPDTASPSDAQVIGAVQRGLDDDAIVVCAAGGLPGELHRHWRPRRSDGYHLEYGYSCMGYEIAGGLGVKFAAPEREVVVMVGDGSYLMMNSELASSVTLGRKLIVVLLDNRGFGCINRLQQATGGAPFNNLVESGVDFEAHARSLGAHAQTATTLGELESALARARSHERSSVIVIRTDPRRSTEAGGWWWDVAVPEVSGRREVNQARAAYEAGLHRTRDRT